MKVKSKLTVAKCPRTPASTAAVLLAGMAVFQEALAVGARWGDHVHGSRAPTRGGQLPTRLRVGAGFSSALLVVFVWVLLARVGVVDARGVSRTTLTRSVWAIMVVMVVNTLGNVTSASPLERWGFGSVTALVAVLAGLTASSPEVTSD